MLTEEQEIALNSIRDWFFNPVSLLNRPYFKLGGLAGTGKTYLLSKLKEALGLESGQIAWGTYTGKAAIVLRNKGVKTATTIHKLIYIPINNAYADELKHKLAVLEMELTDTIVEREEISKTGKLSDKQQENFEFRIDELKKQIDTYKQELNDIDYVKVNKNNKSSTDNNKFILKSALDPDYKLIVIDEASMVGESIHNDLLSFNIPVLYVGDYFQLSPIEGEFNLMDEDHLDAKLSKIQRQALDHPIIRWSLLVRNGESIPYGVEDGVAAKLKYKDVRTSTFVNSDQIISGFKKTKNSMNNLLRQELGYSDKKLPQCGEKLIITKNNHQLNFMNGQLLYALSNPIKNTMKFLNFEQEFILQEDLPERSMLPLSEQEDTYQTKYSGLYDYIMKLTLSKRPYLPELDEQYTITKKEIQDYLFTEFGYCITCHKAQGSEWEKVTIVDDGFGLRDRNSDIRRRWLYTALTRASKAVVLAVGY